MITEGESMPFTISHAAAALPFFRLSRLISRSAVAIGTMVPDLPLFLSFGRYDLSHSAAGILIFNLPVGFLFWLLWQHWMREASADLCPGPLRHALFRYHTTETENWPSPGVVYLSLCLGAATHVFWDGFTHYTGFGTALFPVLFAEIFGIPVFSWLQLLSSAFGMGVILLWLSHRWQPGWDRKRTICACAAWAGTGFASVGFAALINNENGGLYLYGTIVTSVQIFFCTWLAACLLWNLRSIRQKIKTNQYAYQRNRNGW